MLECVSLLLCTQTSTLMKFRHPWPGRVPNDICGFPTIMHPFDDDWQLIVFFLCMCVCVRVWEREWENNIETVVHNCNDNFNWAESQLLAWIGCYRNGMPGSDITFLVVFHHRKASNLLKYVAAVFTEPDCQQRRPWKVKTHWCLLYALCFCSSWACGRFMGLSEVPLEKKPDLKPVLDHLAGRNFEGFSSTSDVSFHPPWNSLI